MDFTLTDEQQLLRDTARTLLDQGVPDVAGPRPHRRPRGRRRCCGDTCADFAALGDGPLTDLCLFLAETGYVAAPGPFFATAALFVPLLAGDRP